MSQYKQAFGDISGGVLLDVATGEGGFIHTLIENLRSYKVIIGIDIQPYTKSPGSIFSSENVGFIQMDTRNLGFEDQSFDTVCISSSLHHLEDTSSCLKEMKRVLKVGGTFIIRETLREALTEPQRNDMDLHHWVAEIDTALGYTHKKTFTRQEILDLVEPLGLCNVAYFDITNTDLNPMDSGAIQVNEEILDRYLRYAMKLTTYRVFKKRGEMLLKRHYNLGVQWEPELIIRGYSPPYKTCFSE